MVTELRRTADAEARRAWHAVVRYRTEHDGKGDPLIDDVCDAAERVVDAVNEWEHAMDALEQRDDPEAPDYFPWSSEGEARVAWGNR